MTNYDNFRKKVNALVYPDKPRRPGLAGKLSADFIAYGKALEEYEKEFNSYQEQVKEIRSLERQYFVESQESILDDNSISREKFDVLWSYLVQEHGVSLSSMDESIYDLIRVIDKFNRIV